jgi:hypothetical protein
MEEGNHRGGIDDDKGGAEPHGPAPRLRQYQGERHCDGISPHNMAVDEQIGSPVRRLRPEFQGQRASAKRSAPPGATGVPRR